MPQNALTLPGGGVFDAFSSARQNALAQQQTQQQAQQQAQERQRQAQIGEVQSLMLTPQAETPGFDAGVASVAPQSNATIARQTAQRSRDPQVIQAYQEAYGQMQEQELAQSEQALRMISGAAIGMMRVPQQDRARFAASDPRIVSTLESLGIPQETWQDPTWWTDGRLDGFIAQANDEHQVVTALLNRTAPTTLSAGQEQVGYNQGEAATLAANVDEVGLSNAETNRQNAGTNAFNAETTRGRLELDSQRGNNPEWVTLDPDDPRRAGFDPGEVVQLNTQTGQVARRSVDRVFNATESQAAGFAGRMNDASNVVSAIEADPSFQGVPEFLWNRPTRTLPEEWQRYRQAGENWIRANLRRESGAVIGEDEMAAEFRVYFPQPGDSPEVIAQKAQSRARAQQAMIAQSRGAYEEYGLDRPTGQTPPETFTGQAPPIVGQDAPPAGVDPADWQFMSPEERALFLNQ